MADSLNEVLHKMKPSGDHAAKASGKGNDADDAPQDLDAYVVLPKGAYALDIEDGANPVVSLQYVYLSIVSEYRPDGFTFFFGEKDRERWKLTVTGRNLRDCYNRINDHCVRKLRKADRPDYAGDGKVVISKITVEPVEEPKQAR